MLSQDASVLPLHMLASEHAAGLIRAVEGAGHAQPLPGVDASHPVGRLGNHRVEALAVLLLDLDIFEMGEKPLGEARILATMIEGEVVYRAPGFES